MSEPEMLIAPDHGQGWTCFHCGETFEGNLAGQRAAAEHFGDYVDAVPGCRLRMRAGERSLLRRIRWLERKLRELQSRVANEDTRKDRQMAAMAQAHGAALRAEEEKGYARGLCDAMRDLKDEMRCPFCGESGLDARWFREWAQRETTAGRT